MSDGSQPDLSGLKGLNLSGLKGMPDLSGLAHTLRIGQGQPGYGMGGGYGEASPSTKTGRAATQATDDQKAQQIVKGLTFGQEQNPGNALIWQLGDLVSKLSPTQAQAIMKEIPAGSTLLQGLNLALGPNAIQASQGSNTNQGDALSQMFGQLFNNTLVPFLQQQQQSGDTRETNLISGMQDALKGSPLAKYYQGIPEELKAVQNQMDTATMESAVSGPQYAGLVNALQQAANNYKAAQSVYGAAPYIAQMYSTGQIPGNLPGVGTGGLLPPPLVPGSTTP